MASVRIEGYTVEELLALPHEQFQAFALRDEALVIQVGSAKVLGKFCLDGDTLILELGHIDGGGEGALVALASLAQRYATREKLSFVEWRVHAIHCARPNLRLRRVLERRGFVRKEIPTVGECYFLRVPACQES
jgi:hypothetical protein